MHYKNKHNFFLYFMSKFPINKYFILYCPVDVRLHYQFDSGRWVITVSEPENVAKEHLPDCFIFTNQI
jgi:hypothetical protein